MRKVVCIKIDALGGFQKGSWAVFRKAIAYVEVEENFPENVPAGKLQVQADAKHYIGVWKRPRILDANGRRSYLPLPSSAMIHVIACVRGTMRYPVEMNSHLLRPVIVATPTTVDGGIYRTLLSQHGGAFKVSADWINKLCVKLRLPYTSGEWAARLSSGTKKSQMPAVASSSRVSDPVSDPLLRVVASRFLPNFAPCLPTYAQRNQAFDPPSGQP